MAEENADNTVVETSISDDIGAAFDKLNEEPEGSDGENTDAIGGVDSSEEAGSSADNQEESGDTVDSGGGEESDGSAGATEVAGEEGTQEGGTEYPTPVGMSEATKAQWAKLPVEVKEDIIKRERDFAGYIQRYVEGYKRSQQMDQALQPFQQYFAMNGGNPAKQVNDLLVTASTLQGGTTLQKAQTVANLIKQFGIDIATLDGILVGETDPNIQSEDKIQRAIADALAPFRQQDQQRQQEQRARHEQMVEATKNEVQAFAADPKNEFYKEVRDDMADLLDMASARRQNMTMQEAYDRACKFNDKVQQILLERKGRSLDKKKKAASSIKGDKGGSGGNVVPESLRGAIEEAWGEQGRV